MAWLSGERRTGVLAKLLGVEELSGNDQNQNREVKRFKDRLLKRIRRFRDQERSKKSRG